LTLPGGTKLTPPRQREKKKVPCLFSQMLPEAWSGQLYKIPEDEAKAEAGQRQLCLFCLKHLKKLK
jgi:hypothetical protein